MVSITSIRASNSTFKNSPQASDLVAVFVGATSGIGLGTLKAFTKNARAPTVYILGRSKSSASTLLSELQTSNPGAKLEFIETEISLLKNVEKACDFIKSKEKKVDILFMSPGYLSFDSRMESTEGIDIPHALRLYTRLLFATLLLPLLLLSPNPRVISILAGGQESPLDVTDLEVKSNFTFIKAAENGTTQTTLAFEELAKSHPSVTFIHKYPGFVSTGVIERLMATAPGFWAFPAMLARWLLMPVVNLWSMSVGEAGERGLFLATSARFPPAEPKSEFLGTELPKGVSVAESSIVKDGKGNGVYRLGALDETAGPSAVLDGYRADGTDKLVLESVQSVFDRALERSN